MNGFIPVYSWLFVTTDKSRYTWHCGMVEQHLFYLGLWIPIGWPHIYTSHSLTHSICLLHSQIECIKIYILCSLLFFSLLQFVWLLLLPMVFHTYILYRNGMAHTKHIHTIGRYSGHPVPILFSIEHAYWPIWMMRQLSLLWWWWWWWWCTMCCYFLYIYI